MANKILPYIQTKKWDFACFIDEASRLKLLLGASALPYIMIVDKNGWVHYTHTAYVPIDVLEAELMTILK